VEREMTEPRIYIPKSIAFQRLAKVASSASRQIDNGVPPNDAHVFALLEYFEFLAPEQFVLVMGPGMAAEFSAVTEHEFHLGLIDDRLPVLRLLADHTSMFAGAFCRDGEEDPRCYREWKRIRQENFPHGNFSGHACLAGSITVAMTLGGSPLCVDSKVQLLKYSVLKRAAEVLLATGYRPEEQLRQIHPEEGPDFAQLLAMQMFVLSKGRPSELAKLCGQINGSSEATFFYWASKDPFVRYLLRAWHWLELIDYGEGSAPGPELLKERGGLLYARWNDGVGAPAGLARRELPGTGVEGEEQFPSVLRAGQRERLSPVPLMLIGGRGVGKTAFLRALALHLDQAGGALGGGSHLEPAEPQGFWNSTGEPSEPITGATVAQPSGYDLRIRDDHDPQVTRWMRLTLTDNDGDDIRRPEFRAEFLKKLRAAKGLLFFVDDRYFLERVSKNQKPSSGQVEGWPKDAVGLAAWYTRILQAFLDVNSDALHLPIGLVINKADLLLGAAHLLTLDSPVLITKDIKMELVHAGLQVPGEPPDPFGRLRYCIRHTLSNSRDLNHQAFIFELLEQFRGFIAAALGHTYRFQIFLTSSVVPNGESGEHFPYGVWEAVKWIVNQLEPSYRVQARDQLEQDERQLEQLKKDIEQALLRDQEAYTDFESACKQKEKRVNAKTHVALLDSVLGRDPKTTGKQIESAKERMRVALEEGLSLANLKPITDAADPLPFTTRRRMVQEALLRLEEQITYLTEWRAHLSHIKPQPSALPIQSKKTVVNDSRNTNVRARAARLAG
jgi:hypothetical protein